MDLTKLMVRHILIIFFNIRNNALRWDKGGGAIIAVIHQDFDDVYSSHKNQACGSIYCPLTTFAPLYLLNLTADLPAHCIPLVTNRYFLFVLHYHVLSN